MEKSVETGRAFIFNKNTFVLHLSLWFNGMIAIALWFNGMIAIGSKWLGTYWGRIKNIFIDQHRNFT